MVLASLRSGVGRLLAGYNGWLVESQARSPEIAQLLDDARTRFDDARAILTDRRSWCWRCGERLRVRDEVGARARDGLHARCYGG